MFAPCFKIFLIISLAAGIFLGGCSSSPEGRIADQQELFESYSPEIQENIRQGTVEIGYTQDMVELALGKPARVVERETKEGNERVFIYTESKPRFSFGLSGASGGGGSAVGTGVGVSTGGKSDEAERIIFRDGKVYAIEKSS